MKPRLWFEPAIGYWLCAARGTYAVAAGMTPREAYVWWCNTRGVSP